jgi:hypothetical protein
MQRHAIALGYFFLAVFCIYVSAVAFGGVRLPMLAAAVAALAAGLGYLLHPHRAWLQTRAASMHQWLLQMLREAQHPPTRQSRPNDESVV